jgi:hypothetical protein
LPLCWIGLHTSKAWPLCWYGQNMVSTDMPKTWPLCLYSWHGLHSSKTWPLCLMVCTPVTQSGPLCLYSWHGLHTSKHCLSAELVCTPAKHGLSAGMVKTWSLLICPKHGLSACNSRDGLHTSKTGPDGRFVVVILRQLVY